MARPVRLFRNEPLSGVLMLAAVVAGLIAANSPLKDAYDLIHHLPVHIRIGPLIIDRPLIDWVNEGLMVFFFLLIGLEIKRQFFEGHLRTAKRAALPAIAALGGMFIPAFVYLGLTWQEPTLLRGWAIPTATDIALALGLLSLLGNRVPDGLRAFLAALAIFDDIGAVIIIGAFYGETISLAPLLLSAITAAGLASLNRLRITWVAPYVVLGLTLWLSMLQAGLEAALAGFIIAVSIPMRAGGCRCSSPVRETERRLHPWCVLLVVPVFAFFNSGIPIDGSSAASLLEQPSLGIVAGLFLGKQLGVFGAVFVAVRLGLGALPSRTSWSQLYGAALLAGVGFTMSLYIATLAFSGTAVLGTVKLAVLIGSAISAVTGLLWLGMARSQT